MRIDKAWENVACIPWDGLALGGASSMTTPDFIIALFYAVDQEMLEVPKYHVPRKLDRL
jgi:hypothetical protein